MPEVSLQLTVKVRSPPGQVCLTLAVSPGQLL